MKKLKIFIDKFIITKIEKLNPKLYRFLTYNFYKEYTKLVNLFKYKDKYFFHSISIEISSYCNRKCNYCPNKYNDTPKEFMSWDIFICSIDELRKIKYSGIVQYHFFNEPLLDNRLPDFVKYVKKHLPNATQVLISNGDFLDIKKALDLSSFGVDKFVITIHDKNPESGLKRLGPIKAVLKHKMRLQTSNDIYLANRGGAVDVSNEKSKKDFKVCPDIRTAIITKNGDIVLCCQDYFRKHVMGNIMKENLIDIWNSYKSIRVNLLKYKKADLPICRTCLNLDK